MRARIAVQGTKVEEKIKSQNQAMADPVGDAECQIAE